jgi:hypothetical protein
MREAEHPLGALTNQVDWDGDTTSKKSSKEDETKNKIPSDSPLGQMLKYWSDNP